MKSRNTTILKPRRGAAMYLCLFMIAALVLVLGLMLEVNYLNYVRYTSQSSSDLASKSALGALYHSGSGPLDQSTIDASKQVGANIFNQNMERSDATSGDFGFGRYELSSSNFQAITSSSQFRNITSVKHDFDVAYQPILGSLLMQGTINLEPASIAVAGRTNVMLCIDASRSMNYSGYASGSFPPGGSSIHQRPIAGSRWYILRDSLNSFFASTSELLSNGTIGMATFGGGLTEGGGQKIIPAEDPDDPPIIEKVRSPLDLELARLDFSSGSFTERRGQIAQRLHEYSHYEALGFGTSLYDGLNRAVDELNNSSAPANRIVILMADGMQTPSLDRPDPINAGIHAANNGVTVFTIGYSVGNPSGLQQIASLSGGKFFAVTNPTELDEAFSRITELLRVRLVK